MKRIRVGYCRVSTERREQDISIEMQEVQLREHGCDEIISERQSAYKAGRAGWDRLWLLVGQGLVEEVLCIDQSRLSRSGDDLSFLALCAEHNTTVRALQGGVIEAQSYAGFISTGVMSLMNQAQSKLDRRKGQRWHRQTQGCWLLRLRQAALRLQVQR